VTLSVDQGEKGCVQGAVTARVSGRDAGRIAFVDFLREGETVGRDTKPPYVRRIGLKHSERERTYTIGARVQLVDRRSRTLLRKVRACSEEDSG
jgi:hypothetical protein